MLFKQIEQNKRRTIYLMLFFSLIILAAGWAIGYLLNGDFVSGIVIAAIILVFYLPITYMSASSQVLRMAGAREITHQDHPTLFNIVEELIIPARLPMPKIYVINDPSPNAFATGIKPEKGVVAVTSGLLEKLNREELEGVVAHELAHIRNYDIRLMTICIALVGVIVILADLGMRMLFVRGRSRNQKSHPIFIVIAIALIILAPIATQVVQFAVSRNREFLADATAVEYTRNPSGIIQALRKISSDPSDVQSAKSATAAMYFDAPFKKKSRTSMFATHPPIERRIERLQRM